MLLLVIVAWSCGDIFNTDEYDKFSSIEASPSVALPLAFGDLSIEDILSNKDSTYIKVGSDGVVYLDYNDTLTTQNIKDLIQFPGSLNVLSTPILVPVVTSNSDQTFSSSRTVSFGSGYPKFSRSIAKKIITKVARNRVCSRRVLIEIQSVPVRHIFQ